MTSPQIALVNIDCFNIVKVVPTLHFVLRIFILPILFHRFFFTNYITNSISKLFCWVVELTKKYIWKILKFFTIPTFCAWFASFLNLYTKLLETIATSFIPKFLFSCQRIQIKYLFGMLHAMTWLLIILFTHLWNIGLKLEKKSYLK